MEKQALVLISDIFQKKTNKDLTKTSPNRFLADQSYVFFYTHLVKSITNIDEKLKSSSSLIHCSSAKIHNNTYKMSTSVKELTVCQNTFFNVEITTRPFH